MRSEEARESHRRFLRERIKAQLQWLRGAIAEIERSEERDYKHADSEARNAAQHLVQVASDAAALAVLNEEGGAVDPRTAHVGPEGWRDAVRRLRALADEAERGAP